jgi:hypothetical protein
MPEIASAAVLNHLHPSIGPMRGFTPRRSCSMRLFRYFDERSFVSPGIWLNQQPKAPAFSGKSDWWLDQTLFESSHRF